MGVETKLDNKRIPDILVVTKDKNMRAYEVQSKSDDIKKLIDRNMKVRKQLKQDNINVMVKIQEIPTWDYLNKRPK